MHPDPGGCGQLDVNAMIFEGHTVVASMPRFRRFVECAFVFVSPDGTRAKLRAGHEQDVTVVTHTGALKVGVAESVNDTVRVVVTPAAVPSLESGVRTELNHAKWRGRTWVGVPMPPGSNPRIDLLVKGFV